MLLTIVASFCAALLFSCEHYNYWQVDIDVALGPPTLVHTVDKRHTSLNFTIKPSFSLPVHKNCTWELQKVLQSTWVSQLQLFVSDIGSLSSSSRMFVNLIASNFAKKHSVLNWFITAQLTAKEPLENILVISIDNTLLENHGTPSIHIPPHTILKSILKEFDPGFPLQMVRLTVMRLLCHWGIDIAHYGPEAVILRNPHKLYNRHPDADVLGSRQQYECVSGTLSQQFWLQQSHLVILCRVRSISGVSSLNSVISIVSYVNSVSISSVSCVSSVSRVSSVSSVSSISI